MRAQRRVLTRAAGTSVLAALTAFTLTACAGMSAGTTAGGPDTSTGGGTTGTAGTADEEQTVADATPLIEIRHAGGFVPLEWAFAAVPEIVVYADGRVVTQGPTTLQYPGPLLPNLVERTLTPEELDALVEAAREAGLLAEPPEYGMPPIADAGAAHLTLTVDGQTYVHTAEALDITLEPGQEQSVPKPALEARRTLDAYLESVRAAVGDATEVGPFEVDSYAVMATAMDAATVKDRLSGEPAPTQVPWPLEVDLADVGPCAVLDGADAEAFGTTASSMRQNDLVTQDGTTYLVAVRPLLPGAPGCEDGREAPRP